MNLSCQGLHIFNAIREPDVMLILRTLPFSSTIQNLLHAGRNFDRGQAPCTPKWLNWSIDKSPHSSNTPLVVLVVVVLVAIGEALVPRAVCAALRRTPVAAVGKTANRTSLKIDLIQLLLVW